MERGAVDGFQKVSDAFVERFFTREGESVEEARARRRETERREAALWLSAGALLVILLI